MNREPWPEMRHDGPPDPPTLNELLREHDWRTEERADGRYIIDVCEQCGHERSAGRLLIIPDLAEPVENDVDDGDSVLTSVSVRPFHGSWRDLRGRVFAMVFPDPNRSGDRLASRVLSARCLCFCQRVVNVREGVVRPVLSDVIRYDRHRLLLSTIRFVL